VISKLYVMHTLLQADLFMYNLSEDLVMIFKKHINKMLLWQQKRAGLMHHVMSEKMGLFYHTNASDIAPITTVSEEIEMCSLSYIVGGQKLLQNYSRCWITGKMCHSSQQRGILFMPMLVGMLNL